MRYCPSHRTPYDEPDISMLEEQVLSLLEDEGLDTATNDAVMKLIRAALIRKAEEEETPEPCTREAYASGCSCTMPITRTFDMDPPDPIVDRDCPLHGSYRDPDDAYDAKRTGD